MRIRSILYFLFLIGFGYSCSHDYYKISRSYHYEKEFDVPDYIDFISMDIEGAEKHVLDYWDFDKYKVKMWCIENGHSYEEFFKGKGYTPYTPHGYELCHGNYFFINN